MLSMIPIKIISSLHTSQLFILLRAVSESDILENKKEFMQQPT
jgi:hypothetical protein